MALTTLQTDSAAFIVSAIDTLLASAMGLNSVALPHS